MMVLMVKELFTHFRFSYLQLPCSTITGDLIFEPFWETIFRLERIGFKVLATTFDGASVNRKMVKLHDSGTLVLYKALNIYAKEERYIYSFGSSTFYQNY
uniref:Transposable element P transposase-like RNase H domain-containing protein n=1 Tax=Amphimedon queenslandica TaxID=400682 RepID=A0A1X7TYC1_AMPQE